MGRSFVRDRRSRKYETFGSDNTRDIENVELFPVIFIAL
jgi:hypothetical protein